MITFPVAEQADADRPQVCDLHNLIRRNNLRVTQLVGVHGQAATLADLEAVVARRTTPCAG